MGSSASPPPDVWRFLVLCLSIIKGGQGKNHLGLLISRIDINY